MPNRKPFLGLLLVGLNTIWLLFWRLAGLKKLSSTGCGGALLWYCNRRGLLFSYLARGKFLTKQLLNVDDFFKPPNETITFF